MGQSSPRGSPDAIGQFSPGGSSGKEKSFEDEMGRSELRGPPEGDGSFEDPVPKIREVIVRRLESTRGYSMIVPIKVKGKELEGVTDTGAEVTIINSKFLDITQFKDVEEIRLKGIVKGKLISGYMVKDVPINLGGNMYRWDLYVAPIGDDFLLGLDFMIAYKVDPLISRNCLYIEGKEIPAIFKRGSKGHQQEVGRVHIARRTVVRPGTCRFVECKVKGYSGREGMVAPGCSKKGLELPYQVEKVTGGKVVIKVDNFGYRPITLKEGFAIGSIEEVEVLDGVEPGDPLPTVRTCHMGDVAMGESEGPMGEPSGETSSEPRGFMPRYQVGDNPDSESFEDAFPYPTLETVEANMPEHMLSMFKSSCANLSEAQSIVFGNLLIEYQVVFARDDTDLGCFKGVEHRIDTGDAKPIKQPMRRVPMAFAGEEEKHLKKMLDCGVIQPSTSEWSSPTVLVRKRDGDIRWCIDFREVNSVTRKDAYPLPLIEQCLDALADVFFMSTLDMNSGYWQLLLAAADRSKTAFQTKDGLYEFLRMPFGLCNAPATFQRAIQLVFRGMTWREVLTYLDDINVLGTGFENHLQNLCQTFERLRVNQLKLKPRKCKFFQTEVPFLGKLATRNGLAVDPKKIEAVVSWPIPTSKKDVESFLGFVNYHRSHIKDYASLAGPLYQVTGKKAEFSWGMRSRNPLRICARP